MTFDQAKSLQVGEHIHHKSMKNADGTPLRCRINGAVKLWKTRPNEIRVPIKHGLRDCAYLTHENLDDFSVGYGS